MNSEMSSENLFRTEAEAKLWVSICQSCGDYNSVQFADNIVLEFRKRMAFLSGEVELPSKEDGWSGPYLNSPRK